KLITVTAHERGNLGALEGRALSRPTLGQGRHIGPGRHGGRPSNCELGDAAAAVFVFLAAAAGARLVAADFWRFAAHRREIELHFAIAFTIAGDGGGDRLALASGLGTIDAGSGLAQKKLR